jgi:hypothetical protein
LGIRQLWQQTRSLDKPLHWLQAKGLLHRILVLHQHIMGQLSSLTLRVPWQAVKPDNIRHFGVLLLDRIHEFK